MGSRWADYGEIVEASLEIFQQYDTAITLRQLYYRLVSRLLITNTVNSYKRLSRIMVKAREGGDVPVNCLEDRSRRVLGRGDVGFGSAEEYLKTRLETLQDSWRGFTLPMWDDQPSNLLISLEKDALSRLVSRIANKYSVRTFPTRGYPSFSYVQEMSRYITAKQGGKKTVVLYFGDFDPSGVDIERDLTERLEKYGATDFEVRRVALTLDQIKQNSLPPMPVKRSDARADGFLAEHGDRAVELDAMDPNIFQSTVEQSIRGEIDAAKWNAKIRKINELKDWIKVKLEDIERVIDTGVASG
ncbi:hypothetical protein A3K69_02310 [Candidatus Bathyarchaeota archaeon RBG_16_57_9]|nr:MAG: hypothetical protein A3K69_02310 [Candidatus Bathyarchaeota archaeon RBG_16_57_9]OGD53690.1 MAG: hypothetical protein A3K81_05620 [Candidatus Bathyarchaeota archaeon RBG_13_60_20]